MQPPQTPTIIGQAAAGQSCLVPALFSNSFLKKTCFLPSGIPDRTSKDAKDVKPDVLETLSEEAFFWESVQTKSLV